MLSMSRSPGPRSDQCCRCPGVLGQDPRGASEKKIAAPRPNQPSVIIARVILDPRARFRGATREHVRSGEEAGGARPLRRRDARRAARLLATARAIRPRAPGPPPRRTPTPPPLLSRTSSFQGEAAKKGGLLNTLLKVAPWKITGPASGPEWQEVPIRADEYRVVAPAYVPRPNPRAANPVTRLEALSGGRTRRSSRPAIGSHDSGRRRDSIAFFFLPHLHPTPSPPR